MRFDAEGHLSITPRQLLGLAYADRRRLIDHYLIVGTPSVLPTYASYYDFLKSAKVEGDGHQIWRIQVIVASLMIVSSVFREAEIVYSSPNRLAVSVTQSVGIAEGPTAIDAAPQRHHFGFRLRLVDKLQPIGGARQRPRLENGERRVSALHTAQTRPARRSACSTRFARRAFHST